MRLFSGFRKAVWMVPLALIGCSRPTAPAHGIKEIVYWTGWSGHEQQVQEQLVSEFNLTHPDIRVRMVSQFASSGMYQKTRIAFAGGATPDVMSTIWDMELAGYAQRDVLEPLDDYLKSSERDLDRDFTPGIAKMVRVDGRVYGLCATTNANFIVYNKALFKQAGLNPEQPPRTIEELDAAAKACTQLAVNGGFVRYGFRPEKLRLWAHVFGGQWADPKTGAVTANHPGNVAALKWMASYGKKYDLRRMEAFRSTFGSGETANGPFFAGKIAMWATGEWSVEYIRRYGAGMQWGWFPMPVPSGGRPNTTLAGGSIFVIPKACRNKREAWVFLNWMTSRKAVADFCAAIHNVPPLKEAGADPRFQNDPLMKFAVDLCNGENSFGAPPLPIWGAYNREITRMEEQAMQGGKDPQKLLDDLQTRMERDLAQVKRDLGK